MESASYGARKDHWFNVDDNSTEDWQFPYRATSRHENDVSTGLRSKVLQETPVFFYFDSARRCCFT